MDQKNQNGDDRGGLVKRKRKTIQILYEIGKPTLKVVKITGRHLESMGTPSRGGFELYPEEAVFLVESGSAIISTVDGRDLNILECYGILEKSGFPMFKYEIYKCVKRTGLVVLRPRAATINYDKIEKAARIQTPTKPSSFFEGFSNNLSKTMEKEEYHDLDAAAPGIPFPEYFPTMITENGATTLRMKIPPNPTYLSILGPSGLSNARFLRCLKNVRPPTRNAKRNKPCRNMAWPVNYAKHAKNWREFEILRNEMHSIIKTKKKKKGYRFQPPKDVNSETSLEGIDYHVFSPASFSHRLPAKPIFTMICCRATGPSLNMSFLAKVKSSILAVEECGKVNFISISGSPINLYEYLQAEH